MGLQLSSHVSQDEANRLQPPSAGPAALSLSNIFGASLVAFTVPILPLEFNAETSTRDMQYSKLCMLFVTSRTSPPLLGSGMNIKEGAPLGGMFAPFLDPLENMLEPPGTLLDYGHNQLTDTTADLTLVKHRHVPPNKSEVEKLQATVEPFTALYPVKLICFLVVFTSPLRALHNPEGISVLELTSLLGADGKEVDYTHVNPVTAIKITPSHLVVRHARPPYPRF